MLSRVVPLQYNATVQLTDSSGATYTSPAVNLGLTQGCTPVTLNFTGGQFQWTGALAMFSPQGKVAEMLSLLAQILNQLQALLGQ